MAVLTKTDRCRLPKLGRIAPGLASRAARQSLSNSSIEKTLVRLTVLVFAFCTLQIDNQSQGLSEYQVKAGVLFHFTKFVDWPSEAFSSPDSPFIIGVVGADPFGNDLEWVLSGKSVNGHPLKLVRLTANQELRCCHILFISSSERGRLSKILAAVEGSSALTVAETDDFVQVGMIRLLMEENRIRFEVNVGKAERAGLRISSKMLSLARRVVR
jgi:hypothetical protein